MFLEEAPNVFLENYEGHKGFNIRILTWIIWKYFLPHSKRSVSVIKTIYGYEEIIDICCENYASYINTLFGQDMEIFSITPDGKVRPGTGHVGPGAEQSIAPLLNLLVPELFFKF